jgi:aryl carrier-like protein
MTTFEQRLREALATLINIDPLQLSVHVNLSEQGVDSLVGLRFARKIEELIGAPVELEWMFDYPTIAQLASYLTQRFGTPTSTQS